MRYAAVVLMLAYSIAGLFAQTPATRPIDDSRFDVVSIKPISRDSPMWRLGGYSPDPTRFHGWFSYTDLLSMGYQIQPNRIVGLPKWTADERYEITAYESLIAMARGLGERDVIELFEKNLKDEKETLREVESVAKRLAKEHAKAGQTA